MVGHNEVENEENHRSAEANEDAFEEFLKTLNDRTAPRYRQRVIEYKEFCAAQNFNPNEPANLEKYLLHLREDRDEETNERSYCSSTLNSINSQLSMWFQSALNIKPFHELPNLRKYLNEWEKEKVDEEVQCFEVQDVYRFLEEAPNNNSFIVYKCVLILSIYGFLRKSEIVTFEFERLRVQPECILGQICRGRIKGPKRICHFAITDPKSREIIELYWSYFTEEERVGRFFRKLDSKTNRPLAGQFWGANLISRIPKDIAKWLGKPNPTAFSCRSLRATGSLMAEVGATDISMTTSVSSQSRSLVVSDDFKSPKRTSDLAIDADENARNVKKIATSQSFSSALSTSIPVSSSAVPLLQVAASSGAPSMCQCTQEQLYRFYPELKPADTCPGCEVKICFHVNYPTISSAVV